MALAMETEHIQLGVYFSQFFEDGVRLEISSVCYTTSTETENFQLNWQ